MPQRPASGRPRSRLLRLARLLMPALATVSLATLLVFTIFFTEFDWQWVAFLSGVLVAAVLSLVSASWKAQWRVARRTLQLEQIKERLAVEVATHRRTSEQLERELALHQQDRERFARETQALERVVEELRESAAPPIGALAAVARHHDAVHSLAGGLRVTDEAGQEVYLSSLTEELTGWSDPQTRIRNAIDEDGFDLHAQDIRPLRTQLQTPRMMEILIRMRDEEELRLPPGAFFPAAEHFGMMPDIDRWVVRKVVAACAASDPARRAELPLVCINAARSTIADSAFPEFVADTLRHHHIPGSLLCFEISDSDVIAARAEAERFASALKRLGCRVSLDGFGSAGVGFDHVKSMPLDFLKIDGRIILAVARDPVAVAKVTAIRRVCQSMGTRTIAEMVESEDVLQKLVSLGVDYAQGFGVARPQPLGALV